MLETLKGIHREILTQIDALEAIVRQPQPQREALASARWRLMRASRTRLKLLSESVYPALADTLPQRIAALRADDSAKRVASAAHIAAWDIDRILADWPIYQSVSADMTMAMRHRIDEEKTVLYPMLGGGLSSSSAIRS